LINIHFKWSASDYSHIFIKKYADTPNHWQPYALQSTAPSRITTNTIHSAPSAYIFCQFSFIAQSLSH